jgi:predicted PurR-regulated permease PerM
VYISLLIIGVDYALLWTLIAFLMNYIPNIGIILAMIPTATFALVQLGAGGALWTIISTLLIHAVVGNFVEPKMLGRGMGLSTLVVILSLLFWGFILGVVGLFLSVPITMAIKIMLEQSEQRKWLATALGTPEEAKRYLRRNEQNEKAKKQKKQSEL